MKKKTVIIITTIVVLLGVFLTPFFHHQSLFSKVKNSIESRIYYANLNELRQEAYDKMKIEYINIKSRITGTAPFDSGEESNTNGIDVSDSDEYIRTFDVMKYTIEVGIGPNLSHEGVTNESVYEGGVIKVRAKLPNQGDLTLMTWEQDAWMKNVSYSDDKTEIYAEYHVPEGVSITNANQNLTFTIRVNGYKKEITNEMKPEFTVWMEGNKEDNDSSSATSVTAKDNRNLIISGKPSLDVSLNQNTWITATYTREVNGQEEKGRYNNFGIGVSLFQKNTSLSDFKGVELPSGKIQMKIELEYRYYDINSSEGWKTLNVSENNISDNLNGTVLVEYGLNAENKPNYIPSAANARRYTGFPYGIYQSSYPNRSVINSGIFDVSKDDNIITVSFDGYDPSGPYPNHAIAEEDSINNQKYGYFAAGNVQFFCPYYDDENGDYNYQFIARVKELSFKDSNGNDVTIESSGATINDGNTSNNSTTTSMFSYLPGGAWTRAEAVVTEATSLGINFNISQPYTSGNGSALLNSEYLMRLYSRVIYGPFEGGMDNILSWNPQLTTIKPYSETKECRIANSSPSGDTIDPDDQVNLYYGIYKAKPNLGTETDEEINAAKYEDFDWYDNYDEALTHGLISGLYVDDPQYTGRNGQRVYFVRFVVNDNYNNIGKTANYRYKLRYYADQERTKVYYYTSEDNYYANNYFKPTTYDELGNVVNTKAPYQVGETVRIIGLKTGIDITVSDVDSSGEKKRAYDVQERKIHMKVMPTLTNDKSPSNSDLYYDNVVIKIILPEGLNYEYGSANKEPISVTLNGDGTTTIIWEYDNWQINHDAPEYPEITFTTDISSSLENNQSISVYSSISQDLDQRDEQSYRSSEYGIVISNLAGSKVYKEIDKPVVEKNEKFNVTSTVGNNGEETLTNMKTIEILPYSHDENGSDFNGTYTTKITSKLSNQKLFYTTRQIAAIGLEEDNYGTLNIKNVDLENDSRWIEVQVGETIPSNATAIATLIPSVPAKTEGQFVMEVNPTGNKELDQYDFTFNMTSDNLIAALKTNTVVTKVIDRRITGKAFIDSNRNKKYDETDELLKQITVKLLDENGNVVKTTQTDTNGNYSFNNLEKKNYYVEFVVPENYETITKGVGSKVNSNGRTDLITGLNNTPTTSVLEVDSIDMGIEKIEAKINVKFVEEGNPSNILDSKKITKYFGDSYNTDTDAHPTIPDNYEYKRKTDNYIGEVHQKEIDVIYYYQKKDSKLQTNIEKEGTELITEKDSEVEYKITYTAEVKDYIGESTITIIDYLPYEIDEEKSSLAGGTYNNTNKTITWEEEKNITSINEPKIKIEKEIKVVFKDLDPEKREMVNKVSGKIVLDNNERELENTYSTRTEIPGIIKEKYIEVDEKEKEIKELKEEKTTEGLVGDIHTLTKETFEGYNLLTEPEGEVYKYSEEEQVLFYKYQKKIVEIKTISNGIGGDITGDEEVTYGEDSTKDKIIIKAEEGYEIDKLIINGKEQDIKGEYVVLDNFKEMKENKLLVVTFKKKYELVNIPDTKLNNSRILTIFGISCILLSLIMNIYAYTMYKKD